MVDISWLVSFTQLLFPTKITLLILLSMVYTSKGKTKSDQLFTVDRL